MTRIGKKGTVASLLSLGSLFGSRGFGRKKKMEKMEDKRETKQTTIKK